MKKILSLIFVLLLSIVCLAGCEFTTTGSGTKEEKVHIVTNIPEEMEVGKAYTFSCSLSNNEECDFEYSISNEKVATINENTITTLKEGKFTITITSSDGEYEEKITVTVKESEEEEKNEVVYTVFYYFEQLDKTYKKTTSYFKGEVGTIVEAEIMEKEGFTFDPTNKDSFLQGTVTEELELSVYYTRNSYKLTYMNGDTVYKTSTLKYEETITLALGPNKTGYNFISWQLDGQDINFNKMPAHDVTLDANFKENTTFQYTSEYYFETLDGNYEINSAMTTKKTAEKGDYVSIYVSYVEGFSIDASNSNNVTNAVINDGTTVLKQYYKRISYTLVYVVDGVTIDSQEYKFGESVTMMSAPTKEGYDFTGWSEVVKTMPAQNKTINGSFVKHSESITVNMNLNGGYFAEDESFNITHFRDGMNLVYGISGISLSPKENANQGSGIYWLKVCLKQVSGYSNIFTIVTSVSSGTGISTVDSSTYTYVLGAYEGEGLSKLSDIVTANSFSPLYIVIDEIPATIGEVSVTAHCYTELYKATGKVNAIDSYVLPTPTKAGYNFGGWYVNPDYSGSPVTIATSTCTLYAKWTNNDVYTACMVAQNNGNQTTEGNEIVENGYKIYAKGFISNYVVFQVYKNGVAQTMAPSYWTWTSSNDDVIAYYSNYSCTGSIVGEGTTTITITNAADNSIVASFTAIVEKKTVKYGVTLHVNNGVCSNLTEYTYGVGATLPVPTRNGFSFGGWYDNEGFQGSAITMISNTDSGNKEFYAKWDYDEDTPNIDYLIPSMITDTINLPSDIGEYEIEWLSSNSKLITFESGNILTVHKGGQTHQNQSITITMKATKNGHTDTYTKTTTVGPVVFDDLTTPVAAYVNCGAFYHYTQYDNKDCLFSEKAKAALDIVYYTTISINADGTFSTGSTFDSYKAEVLALRETGTRVLVMIGGSAANFKSTCENYVDKFATGIVNYIVANGFDGVDLDWEFPMSTAEGKTYTTLMAAIRTKFDQVQAEGGTNYMITSAIPASGFSYERFDWQGLNTYCDYINMMSYDGNKSDTTSHQSPIYKSSYDNGWGNIGIGVDWGVKAFTSKGLAKSKIIIGCACYGKSFKVTGTSTSKYPGLGCAASLCNAGTVGSHDSGTIYYYGIEQLIASGKYTVYTEYNTSGQFVSSYLYSDETKIFVTYETPEMYAQKYAYAKANGLGIMCWSMPEDASDNYINTMYACKFNK